MAQLEFKNKFTIQNNDRKASIDPNTFHRWTNNHFYKTTYNTYERGQAVSITSTHLWFQNQ